MSRETATTNVHETAFVAPGAELAGGVTIGAYCRIGPQAKIGPNTRLDPYVIVEGDTSIGRDCRVHSYAVLGTEPQDVKYDGKPSSVVIGDRNIIREFVTVNRASDEGGVTRVGNDNFLMTYVHIAHNCTICGNTVIANAVNMAGYVLVEDYAFIGGVTPVHQFVRIGRHSIIGGGCRVPKDVPPFVMAAGVPLKCFGLNRVGLKRRGFSPEAQLNLKRAYRILFRSGLNTRQALERIEAELESITEIKQLVTFVRESDRGIVKE
jgi:UDP-N-acetylglucosamine acyltransferase